MTAERWDVEQRGLRWYVVHVVDCGMVAGVLTKPFRQVERRFWRFASALRYAVERKETAHIRVAGHE